MCPPTCRVCRGGCGALPTSAAGVAAAVGRESFLTAIAGSLPPLNHSIYFYFPLRRQWQGVGPCRETSRPGGGIGWNPPARKRGGRGKTPAGTVGKRPGRWSGRRKPPLRLDRRLGDRKVRAAVERWKTGARAARRHERRAPPPGPLGLWVDCDTDRCA